MPITTRTLMGSKLQTHQYYGIPYNTLEFTTLNEAFQIANTETPTSGEMPVVRYFVIGDKGHQVTLGANGRTKVKNFKHRRTDFACFNNIPFLMREVTNDISGQERDKYCLRKIMTGPIDNKQYVAYFGKRFNPNEWSVELQITDGSANTVPFVSNNANLKPEVPTTVETTDSVSNARMTLPIRFDETDVVELRNVARVLYGDEEEAIVSEIGLVAGIDRNLSGTGVGGASITYKEVITALVTLHITCYYQMDQHNDGFSLTVNGGVAEALDMNI